MEVILSLSGVSHKYFIWSEGEKKLYSLQSEADPDSGTYTINGFNTYIINNGFDVSKVTSMNSMFENASSFTGCAADLWGRAADLPANFGTFGGDHVAINGPVDYWVYDPSDGNIIVAREDSNVLKMIKISQDGINCLCG